MPLDLSQARADLEAQLTDTVRISRTAGQPVLDPVTGEPGQTPTTVVYDGPGAVLCTRLVVDPGCVHDAPCPRRYVDHVLFHDKHQRRSGQVSTPGRRSRWAWARTKATRRR